MVKSVTEVTQRLDVDVDVIKLTLIVSYGYETPLPQGN